MTDNELIARFMGWHRPETEYFYEHFEIPSEFQNGNFNHRTVFPEDVDKRMRFDTSHDWLIPVVKKIYTLDCECAEMMVLEQCSLISQIGSVYAAVLKFIHWYNEQKP